MVRRTSGKAAGCHYVQWVGMCCWVRVRVRPVCLCACRPNVRIRRDAPPFLGHTRPVAEGYDCWSLGRPARHLQPPSHPCINAQCHAHKLACVCASRSRGSVCMHSVARRCGYPERLRGGSSATTSTASLVGRNPASSGAGWIAACGSHPARSRPATRVAHVWRASATNTYSVTFCVHIRHSPGLWAEPLSVSARAADSRPLCWCAALCSCLRHASSFLTHRAALPDRPQYRLAPTCRMRLPPGRYHSRLSLSRCVAIQADTAGPGRPQQPAASDPCSQLGR